MIQTTSLVHTQARGAFSNPGAFSVCLSDADWRFSSALVRTVSVIGTTGLVHSHQCVASHRSKSHLPILPRPNVRSRSQMRVSSTALRQIKKKREIFRSHRKAEITKSLSFPQTEFKQQEVSFPSRNEYRITYRVSQ